MLQWYPRDFEEPGAEDIIQIQCISTSYNMAARALADLSHKGAKRPSAINQLSARAACYNLLVTIQTAAISA